MPPHLFTVGSNPTAVTHALQSVLGGAESGGTVPLWSFDSTVKRCGGMPLALAVAGLLLATRLCDICALEHCLSLWHRPCRDPGSNRGPSDLRSDALPAELSRLERITLVYHKNIQSLARIRPFPNEGEMRAHRGQRSIKYT